MTYIPKNFKELGGPIRGKNKIGISRMITEGDSSVITLKQAQRTTCSV